MKKETIIFGVLAAKLDARGNRWRPTIALCQIADLPIARLELLHQKRYKNLADAVASDIADISHGPVIRLNQLASHDPWDFEGAYSALYGFTRDYQFKPEQEEYLVHIGTGTHAAQISLFLLTESNYFPARLIQTWQSDDRTNKSSSEYRIVDLDLTKYSRIASRFEQEHRDQTSFLKGGIETR